MTIIQTSRLISVCLTPWNFGSSFFRYCNLNCKNKPFTVTGVNSELKRTTYAVASKILDPGDLIISESPLTYGPKSDSPPICLGCHGGVDGKTTCCKCGWPVCNDHCEKLPIHSENECEVFSKVKIKFTPVEDLTLSCPQYECITPLRVLLLKERQPERWETDIAVLESHNEERKQTSIWNVEEINIVGFLHKVCRLQDRFSAELIHFVCGILEINAFAVPTHLGYEIRCLYPKTSLLAHSCVPNVGHFLFSRSDNFQINVRAMVKIEKGQELFLSYTQTLAPTLFRRAHLKEGKFFDCSCQRCADPAELGTNLSTLKCTKCDNGWVLSSDSLDENAQWKCTCCEFTTKGESVLKAFHIIEKEIEELDFETEDPIVCREVFIKKYKSVLHPNHAFLLNVKSSLTQLYGKCEGYLLEDLPDIVLERKIDLCHQINTVSQTIKPGLSRQRGWNLYEMHAPIMFLARNQFKVKAINEKQLRVKLEEVAAYLEEAAVILSYDDPSSPEGTVSKIAFQSLKELKMSLEKLPK